MKTINYLIMLFLFSALFSCAQQKRFISYKIKKGENIEDIADRLKLQKNEILRLNPGLGENPEEGTSIVIPETEISSNINDTNGVKIEHTEVSFETHTVKPGETIYKITRLYEISKETLIKWNPEYPKIKENLLDSGQVLKVKKIEKKIVKYIESPKEDIYETTNIFHTIEKGDTLFSLTQKYNITKEILIELNPENEKLQNDILNLNDKIIVGIKSNKKKLITHTIRQDDTIFKITQKYNVTQEQLIRLNPNNEKLANGILELGVTINIKKSDVEETEEIEYLYEDKIISKNTIKIGFLYPFNTINYREKKPEDIFKNNRLINMLTDHYLGAQIAIDSIRKQGVNVIVEVFDTGRKDKLVNKLINENKLRNFNALIGPFYANEAEKIANTNDTNIVFPHYSKKQKDFNYSNLIKTAPEGDAYLEVLAKHLKNNYNNQRIFIVGDGKRTSNKQIEDLVVKIQENDSIKSSNINVLKPEKGYIKQERFAEKIVENKENWIVLVSNKTVTIANTLNSLLTLPHETKFKVFALNKSKAFDKLDNNKLAKVKFTYVSDYYVDLKNPMVTNFTKKYKLKNNSSPTNYSFKGFDITYDILARLATGDDLNETFERGTSKRLANKFKFRNSKSTDSYGNKGLYIVQYNKDLSLIRIDKKASILNTENE